MGKVLMHSLTELLFGKNNNYLLIGSDDSADEIIRSYLTEKARTISFAMSVPDKPGMSKDCAMQILGLSEPSEKCALGWNGCNEKHHSEDSMKKEEVWCSHTTDGVCMSGSMTWYGPSKFQFCPICGTPRPVKKTLGEKLWKIMKFHVEDFKKHGSTLTLMDYEAISNAMAIAAEAHFNSQEE